MKNENTENLANEEKNDDLKGTTIASVILLEDQTEKVMQTAMRVTAEKYGATVIEGQSGGELERETRLLSDYLHLSGQSDGIACRSGKCGKTGN